MERILVASPDKISLKKFTDFFYRILSDDYKIGEMHSLMTLESIKEYLNKFLEISKKGIFTYYAKRKINVDPLTVLPVCIQETMDIIIWFDLYSTEPKIIKNKFNEKVIDSVIKNWNDYVKSLS